MENDVSLIQILNSKSNNNMEEVKFLAQATHLKNIPIDQIILNPFIPRLKFDKRKMKILRASIEKNGELVPITVFWNFKKEKYTFIDVESARYLKDNGNS